MINVRDGDPLYDVDDTTMNEWVIGLLASLGLIALVAWNVSGG